MHSGERQNRLGKECTASQVVACLCSALRARHNVRPVPSAATERLKECRCIGVAVGACLNQTDDGYIRESKALGER